MPHPSPRWRVRLEIWRARNDGVYLDFTQNFEVSAQKAATAAARVLHGWQRESKTRITRYTDIHMHVACLRRVRGVEQ